MMSSDKRAAHDNNPYILSRSLFKTLDFMESRKRFFGTSIITHAALLSILLVMPLIYTDTIKVKFDVVLIAPPLPKQQTVEPIPFQHLHPQEPVIQPRVLPSPTPPKPMLVEPPEVRLQEVPQIARLKQPEVSEPEKPVLAPAETPVPVVKMPEVRTGMFASDSSPLQTASRPAQTVQTGGFGDQAGRKEAGRSPRIADFASFGSFDLPDAANVRNGNGRNSERAVHQGGFGDVGVSAKPEPLKKRTELEAAATPVEILFKPKPDYTDKARVAKVEGEVLLRVIFSAMGDVRVLDIVRGLGYGLDENAVRAAQQIKFRPAHRDGQPADSTATVHIVFQLAY